MPLVSADERVGPPMDGYTLQGILCVGSIELNHATMESFQR